MVKLYFGGAGHRLSFGLPPTGPSLDAYRAMLEPTGLPWSVAVLGGDVIGSGLARLALDRGGHGRVGLEDFAGESRPSNQQLVRDLEMLCDELGRPIATCADARRILGLPAKQRVG